MDDLTDTDEIRNDYLRHGRHSERAEEFDDWLRSVREEAWKEGHSHCFHVENPNNPIKGNPYRKDN